MTLKQPTDTSECVYFTNRSIGNGKVKAWVFRQLCPKCGKGLMGKPRDPKTGKPKIRAQDYSCPECHYTAGKEEYEDTLTANIEYICQHCAHSGELQAQFKRRKTQIFDEETGKKASAELLRFQCQKCGKNIDITKKMKGI